MMIVIVTPYKKEIFRKEAEEYGLVFQKAEGMKLYFQNAADKDDKTAAQELKKKCKKNAEIAAVYFSVTAE